MKLSLYKKKRNFNDSPEPSGSVSSKKNKLIFVVQKHDASHLHYDFRLQLDAVLKSWAIPKGPSMDPSVKRLAVMVEDHPLDYGKFYGIIPEGNYGAGIVEIWDRGTYVPFEIANAGEYEKILKTSLTKGDIKINLNGHYLKGAFALVRMNDGKQKNWLLIKKKDDHALKNFDINELIPVRLYNKKETDNKSNTESFDDGNKTGISNAWRKLKKPMLAKLTDKISFNEGSLYEIKYDGYRAVTKISKGKAEMLSRNGKSFNKTFEKILKEFECVKDEIIIDGEITIPNSKGVPDFQMLQNFNSTGKGKLEYHIFDLLYLNGYDISGMTLTDRKDLLKSFFHKYKFKNIHLSRFVKKNARKFFESLIQKGFEGIMKKDPDSNYYPGKRSSDWLKYKPVKEMEVVIGGYTSPQNSRKYFGSLILGFYNKKDLVFCGNCGTGFTDTTLKELYKKLEQRRTDKSPFKIKPVMKGGKGKPSWVKPDLVCTVKFSELTTDGQMRHPVFKGLRNDKKASEVKIVFQ